jgi:hypothetical protein
MREVKIASEADAVIFSLKYFGTSIAILWNIFTWNLSSGWFLVIFITVLCYIGAYIWGLVMWRLVWREHAPDKDA